MGRLTVGMPAPVRRIVAEVAAKHHTTTKDLLSRSRFKEHVAARSEAMGHARDLEPTPSYPRIGGWFGRHHTTIIAGVRRYRASLVGPHEGFIR